MENGRLQHVILNSGLEAKATQRKSTVIHNEILLSSSALHSRTEVLPLQGYTSRVWQYFGFPV